MTPYGIDRTRINANRPRRARLRWAVQNIITPWAGALLFIAVPILLVCHIEGSGL